MSTEVPTSISEIHFDEHAHCPGGTRGVVNFPNGYGASIITGEWFYTDAEHPYEVAVMHNGSIDYSHGIEENTDVFGYCTELRVLHLLKLISELPARS